MLRTQRDAKKTSDPLESQLDVEEIRNDQKQLSTACSTPTAIPEEDVERPENPVVENWSSGKFQETYIINDPNEYVRDVNKEPGRVLIFNYTFEKDKDLIRSGTQRDLETLISTFGRLGINVNEEDIQNDLKRSEVFEIIDNVLNSESGTNCNCFILIFLTHGSLNNELVVNDGSIFVDEVWEKLGKCKKLKNVPKLLLIQACKGKETTAVDSCNEKFNIVPNNIFNGSVPSDILTVFSAREGSESYRDTSSGSWFIQEFCNNALLYGKLEDVDSLITRTAKCVANTYYYHENGKINKQMPTSISTLTKKFYLTTNKYRQMLWEEINKNDHIINILKKYVTDNDGN